MYGGFDNKPEMPVVARSPKLRLCSYFSFSAFDLGRVPYERTKKTRITATPMNGPEDRLFSVARFMYAIEERMKALGRLDRYQKALATIMKGKNLASRAGHTGDPIDGD